MEQLPFGVLAALVGLVGGAVLGLAARLGDFCTLGALETAIYSDDQLRLRLWGVVVGTAILGTCGLGEWGLIDVGATIYHSLAWNPAASIFGGLVFGYGMALAGNCSFGALVRFGGGDLRSLVVVVVTGIFGFVALAGPLAPLRILLFPQAETAEPQGMGVFLSELTGASPLLVGTALSAACLVWAFSHAPLRHSLRHVAWGVLAGLTVVWALAMTTWLADDSLGAVAVEGFSFTAPIGRTLMYLMSSTAGGLSFSVGAVVGVMLGALVGSLWRGRFRWEACEDPRELGRQVSGAALMGVGGVVAMGCSIGQGVSAMATLAWSGPVTLAAIVLGAGIGLRHLIRGFEPG